MGEPAYSLISNPVRNCAKYGSAPVRFPEFKRKACHCIYHKRLDKASEACRKLKKSYPEVKWHKPLNANDVTEEESGTGCRWFSVRCRI